MTVDFTNMILVEYMQLLKDNAKINNFTAQQRRKIQDRLLQIEKEISSEEIIACTKFCFPRVQNT